MLVAVPWLVVVPRRDRNVYSVPGNAVGLLSATAARPERGYLAKKSRAFPSANLISLIYFCPRRGGARRAGPAGLAAPGRGGEQGQGGREGKGGGGGAHRGQGCPPSQINELVALFCPSFARVLFGILLASYLALPVIRPPFFSASPLRFSCLPSRPTFDRILPALSSACLAWRPPIVVSARCLPCRVNVDASAVFGKERGHRGGCGGCGA